jgi:ankyrin repeat protein
MNSWNRIIIGVLILSNVVFGVLWQRSREAEASLQHEMAAAGLSPDQALLTKADATFSKDDLASLKKILDEHPQIINETYGNGHSTLIIGAAWWGKTDEVEELLNRKADLTARNRLGRTALHACINNGGSVELVKMLLEHGADVSLVDNSGKTPMKLALEKNRPEIVDLLRQQGAKD